MPDPRHPATGRRLAATLRGAAVLCLLALGIAAAPLAARANTADGDAALALPVPADKALVYVVRPSEFGPGVPIELFVNDRSVGSTFAQTFFVIEAPPGTVHFASKGDNRVELTLQVEAGQRYYVLQGARLGVLSAMTSLQIAPEFLGREGVQESRLIRHIRL